jgi:hypothetical protein
VVSSLPQRPDRCPPVAAAAPSRFHRRAGLSSRCRLGPTARMSCASCKLSPEPDLVLDEAQMAEMGHLRRGAAAETVLRRAIAATGPVPLSPLVLAVRSTINGSEQNRVSLHSESSDRDPAAERSPYRFAPTIKSGPSISDPAGGIRSALRKSLERRIKIRRPLRVDTPSQLDLIRAVEIRSDGPG